MDKILISACLVGEKTRYDGKDSYWPFVEKLRERYTLIPFCPEVMGGLSVPRVPCEIKKGDVVSKEGVSFAKEYQLGAKKALEACRLFGIGVAILKESSPSCGVRNIYDGHFNGTKIQGKGITTALLEENGIKVYSSLDDLNFLLSERPLKDKEFVSYEERMKEKSGKKEGRKSSFGKKKKEYGDKKKPFHSQRKLSYTKKRSEGLGEKNAKDKEKRFEKGDKKPFKSGNWKNKNPRSQEFKGNDRKGKDARFPSHTKKNEFHKSFRKGERTSYRSRKKAS